MTSNIQIKKNPTCNWMGKFIISLQELHSTSLVCNCGEWLFITYCSLKKLHHRKGVRNHFPLPSPRVPLIGQCHSTFPQFHAYWTSPLLQQTLMPGSCAAENPERLAAASRVDGQAPSALTLAPPGVSKEREGKREGWGGEEGLITESGNKGGLGLSIKDHPSHALLLDLRSLKTWLKSNVHRKLTKIRLKMDQYPMCIVLLM